MKNLEKYKGIIPAFYACYDDDGFISENKTKEFALHLLNKGVKGLYICGSSGECIYQSKEERKKTLEAVMEVVKGKMTIIAHVACNNTADSMELAKHAESLGVDAIASIPPIYFKLDDTAISNYWNDISSAASNTDFIIYNIPQLAGVSLGMNLYKKMLENANVIGVKNSSMPVQDIQMFKSVQYDDTVVFNGPDEQLVSGLVIGADGGIGGTYAVMPEVYLKIQELVKQGALEKARELQYKVNDIIYEMCALDGNLYAVMKEIIKLSYGLDLGGVRRPLTNISEKDIDGINNCKKKIDLLIQNL